MKKIKQFSIVTFDIDGQIFTSKNGVKAAIRAYNRKNKTSLKIDDFDTDLFGEQTLIEDLKVGDYISIHRYAKKGYVTGISTVVCARYITINCDGVSETCPLTTGEFKIEQEPEEPKANLIKEVSKKVFEIKEFFEFGNGEQGNTEVLIEDGIIYIGFEYTVQQESDIGDIYEANAGIELSVEHLGIETTISLGYVFGNSLDTDIENAGIETIMQKIEEFAGQLEPVNNFDEI